MATKVERVRELARKYEADIPKDKAEENQETISKVERVRQLAEKYGVRLSEEEDGTVRAYQTLPTPTGYQRPVSDLGAHGRVTVKLEPKGETQRSGTKGEGDTVLPGARWNPEKRVVNASVRTSGDVKSELDATDGEISDLKRKITAASAVFSQPYYIPAESEQEDLKNNRARLTSLEASRERLQQEWSAAKTQEYDALKDRADFADNSSYRSTRTDTSSGVHRPVTAQSGIQSGVTGYEDWVYEYINKNSDISQAVRENRMNELMTANGASAQGYDLSFLEQMHDEEIAKYNYLYSTQGKDAAQEYLDFIQSDPYYRDGSLNKRQREETERDYKKFADDHPVLASAVTVAQLPATTTAYAGQVVRSVLGEELDPNASYNKSLYTKNAVRDNVTKQVEKRWGKKGSFAYNVGMSMADFLAANALTGGVGASLVLGSGAAAETTLAALERGVDDTGALVLGAVAGAAEYFTEKISVERLFSNEWNEHALKYVVKNALSEGGEEFASSVTNLVADILISKDKSEWQQSINAYMEQGFTAQQALDFACRDQMLSIGLDFLAGAASGTLMAGTGVAIGKGVQAAGTAAVNRESGRQVQDAYRTAVNDSRVASELGTFQQEAEDTELNTFQTDKPYTETPEADAVFRIGSDPEYGQLMTLAEQDKAKAIEAAPDDLTKTTIKYGASREQYNQAKALAKITGKDIVFFEQEGENGTVKNGFYKPSEDRIYLNVRSKNAVPVTVAHELTHTLQSTGGYGDLKDIVFAEMQRTGKDIGKLRTEKAELYAKAGEDLATQEEVDQEIVSEFAEKFLGDVSKIREIYREKPSLAKKITRALDRMLIRATGMENTTAKAFLERASAMYHRVDEIVETSEKEINRRLDEEEAQAAGTAPAAQESPVEAEPSPAVQQAVQTTAQGEPAVQKPTETAGQRQTAPQTRETVSGGVSEGAAANAAQEGVRTSMDESDAAEEMLEDLNRRYAEGDMTDEEYDEEYALIEEARMTGQGIERSATTVDYPEGKIPRTIREKLGFKKKDSGEQYSISYTEDNRPVAVISEDILGGVPRQDWVRTVKRIMSERFRNGVPVSGRNIRINRETRNEYTNSEYTKRLRKEDDVLYAAKMRAAAGLDDVVLASTDYINEELKHERNDNFVQFAKGNVLLEVGENPYSADVVVGYTSGNNTVLYDVVNVKPADFKTKAGTPKDGQPQYAEIISEVPADNSVSYDSENVKGDDTEIQYSISEDGDTTPYGSLPTKAQTRVRDLEYDLGRAMDKMFGLGMTYKSPEFRKWIQDNLRPLVNTYLETGSIPQEESDALFGTFFNPLSGADEALQKQEFYNAFDQMENGLRDVARWAESMQPGETESADNPMPTTEEAEELFRAQRDARREMDKVMYKLLLTPQDEVTVGELLRGTKSEDQITENRNDILEAYRVQKAFNEADAAVGVYKKRLKAELYKHVDTYLGNIADWKDKGTPFLYHRETPERNIRDIIPDKAEAEAFIAEFITPVHHAEAERQRFIGEYQDRIAKLNISDKQPSKKEYAAGKRSEAYAVQFIGEAEENIRILGLSGKRDQKRDGHTLEEWKHGIEAFWAANPDMDRAKIENAVKEFRQIYNELLPKINEVRIRNGYAPVPVRQGYFPHFSDTSEDTLMAKLLRPFGIQFGADVLPTTINGRTADFRPGISYFQFGNQRLGFNTTYDALQGFSMYLNAASNVIYHTDNIQKLRALANRIRYLTSDEGIRQQLDKIENDDSLDEAEKQERRENVTKDGRYLMSNFVVWTDEYTNILANKKSRFDRSVEELAGRNFYNFMKAVENRVAGNMIAGNLGSALTNIIPLNQAAAMLSGGNWLSSFVTAKGERKLLQAMWLTLQERGDGFASMSDFLTNRRGTTPLVRTGSQKFSDKISKPMEIIDNFVSETIVRAFYRENLANGMSEELALRHADAMAASIMADRSKGALPTLFHARNPLMKLFTQFQVEVNNEYSVIFKDIPELAKANAETKAGVVGQIAVLMLKYFVGAKIFNDLFEKLFGRRPALDPAELINDAVGGLTGYQMPNTVDFLGEALTGDLGAEDFAAERREVGQVIGDLRTGVLENLPFIGGLAGGGRLSIQSAFPDAEALESVLNGNQTWGRRGMTLYEELSKPAAYLLPPVGGGQLRNMLNGIIADVRGGVYDIKSGAEGGEYLKYPIYDDPWNMFSSAVFGPIHTEGGVEWIDSGYKNLSVDQTAAYEMMKNAGADDRAAFDLIQTYKSVPDGEGRSAVQRDVIRNADLPGAAKYAAYYNLGASENQQGLMDRIVSHEPVSNLGEAADVLLDIADVTVGKTARACDILAQSGLTEETKRIIHADKVSEDRGDDIAACEAAGISFDEYLDAHSAYSEIGSNKELSKSEQALEFSRYVDSMNLTEYQKDTLRDTFRYYSQVPVQAKNYNELRDLGISDDYAYKLTQALDDLQPLPGEKTVSSIQKARMVIDTISDSDERLAALGTVLTDAQYKKVSAAADSGLDPETWVSFREILPDFDADGNGSYTQEEIEDAIDAFSDGRNYRNILPRAAQNLTRDEKAILWQISGNWKADKNPYSKTTGNRVKNLLDAEKKG